MYNSAENGVIFMGNCKRCGALIGDEFVFCGRCGAPVYDNQKEGKVIKAKKLKKLKKFERKISSSASLNIVMFLLWAVISALWVLLFFGAYKDIRIASAGIGDAVGQLMSKYAYVKEGLSLSYISAEFSIVADYVLSWSYAVFSVLAAVGGIILSAVHFVNFIGIKKGKRFPKIMKLRSVVSKILMILIFTFVIILIAIFVMKGVI